MADLPPPRFTDNAAIRGRESHYAELQVETARILESWRESLFSFEWLRPDGTIKPADELPPNDQARRQAVEKDLRAGGALEKPVLGIGMLDNVEIGAGRAVFLTLAANGVASMPVHVPQSHIDEFKSFIVGAAPKAKKKPRRNESGNIVFYLLMAVVILAALVAAVARSNRESVGFLSADRQRLIASEIMDYGDSLMHATAQLRLRGVRVNQLSFAAPGLPAGYGDYDATTPEHEIFNPAGGGINYKQPPADAMKTPGDYAFVASNVVDEVGTTCAAASCADLMVVAGPLKPEVCGTINMLLHITAEATDAPPTVSALDTGSYFAGTASYSATIGGTSETDPINKTIAACVKNTGDSNYYYYQVILPQ